jgi:hypothetical protein
MRLCVITGLLFLALTNPRSGPLPREGSASAGLPGAGGSAPSRNCTVVLIAGHETDPMSALLEVRLSQVERLRLVERTELDRVLQEQQLSVAGLVERDSIVKAGQLLRAHAFALISAEDMPVGIPPGSGPGRARAPVDRFPPDRLMPEDDLSRSPSVGNNSQAPTGQLIRVRVVETTHGLRLWEAYEQLSPGDVEAVSTRIAGTLLDVLRKIAAPPGQVVPVGIVDIHRVQLPEKYEPLARVLPGLLSARLSKEPRIIMLERESLGTLLREKQLTAGEESPFWSSAVLIDGSLHLSGSKGIELSLRLRRADGKELPTIEVGMDLNSPAVAIATAAVRIVKVVSNSTASGQWSLTEEAAEFHKQGRLLAAHERREAATIMFESAHALEPQNVDYTAALFTNELPRRQYISDSTGPMASFGTYSDLQMAELASVLVHQIRDQYHAGKLSAGQITRNYAWALGDGWPLGYFTSYLSVTTDQVRLVNRESRRIWAQMYEEALRTEMVRPGDPISNVSARTGLVWVSSDEPDRLMARVRKTLNEAILPPAMGGTIVSDDDRCRLCELGLYGADHSFVDGLTATQLHGSEERFLSLWMSYLEELCVCGDPLVEFHACMTLAERRLGRSFSMRSDPQAAMAACRRLVDILLSGLDSPDEPVKDSLKVRIRKFVAYRLATASYVDPNEAVALWEKICRPLVEARDAHNLAIWYSDDHTSRVLTEAQATRGRSSRFLEQVIDVLEAKRDDPQVVRTLTLLHAQQKRRGSLAVNVDKEVRSATWQIRTMMLLTKADWPGAASDPRFYNLREGVSLATIIEDDTLWVGFGMGQANAPPPCSIGLAGLDLPHRRLKALWKVEFNIRGGIGISGLSVSGNQSYAAVPWIGIVEFPGSEATGRELIRAPRILTDKNGLPSLAITGMASAGERLWVAYGAGLHPGDEGGLGLYHPVAESWESVLCSTANGNPPFNNTNPYGLFALTPAPPDKLFFFVAQAYQRGTQAVANGLWRMDVRTKELKYFGLGGIRRPGWGHVVADHKPWVFCDRSSLVEFDPGSERGEVILGEPSWTRQVPSWDVKRVEFERADLASEESQKGLSYGPWFTNSVDLSEAAIHENRVWARLGPSQLVVIPCRGTKGSTIITDNNLLDGSEAERFVSTPYGLIAIGNGTVGLVETADVQSTEPR